MKTMRRLFLIALIVCFAFTSATSALAAEYNLGDGSIIIDFQDGKQYVTQSSASQEDSNPVITSGGVETSNTITVSSGEGQTAQFTIEDVNISTDRSSNAIDIADGSEVIMTVSGTNHVDNKAKGSGTSSKAVIHVGDASLTVKGDESSETNKLIVGKDGSYSNSNAAGIGSNKDEAFDGEINIEGNISVTVGSGENSSAIGSGSNGDFNGELNIRDGASVWAESANRGAAIGAGRLGDFTGEINISNSDVYADAFSNGAGIGSGFQGEFSGRVSITDNSDVEAVTGYIRESDGAPKGEGAGIGAGYDGDFSGTVLIKDSTVSAKAYNDGAAIGTGGTDNDSQTAIFSGEVTIDNSNVTLETHDKGIPLGAPEIDGEFSGSISIDGKSEVTLIHGRNSAPGQQVLIGGAVNSGTGSVSIDKNATIKYWTGNYNQSGEISYDDGSFSTAESQEELKEIIKNDESFKYVEHIVGGILVDRMADDNGAGVYFELADVNAGDEVRVELFSGDQYLTCKTITAAEDGTLECIFYTVGSGDSWNQDTWTAYDKVIPTHAVLYINGEEITQDNVEFTSEEWAAFPGTKAPVVVYIPPVQTPDIDADEDAVTVTLSFFGDQATLTPKEGYEIADVIINGVSMGVITELKGLKTGDKVVIATNEIQTEVPEEEDAMNYVLGIQLVARSKMSKAKGKDAVKVYWYAEDGSELDLDGYEIYRSTKRYGNYGAEPIFTTERTVYWNTAIEKGEKYFYKVYGYKVVDGEKVYTEQSLKAWRTAE